MEREESIGRRLPVQLFIVGVLAVMGFSWFRAENNVDGNNVIDVDSECASAYQVYARDDNTMSESEYLARCRGQVEVREYRETGFVDP